MPLITIKMYKSKTDRIKERYRNFYNNNWSLQYPTFNNGYDNQTEISKEIEDLNNIIYIYLTDIYTTLYSITKAHTFFSSAHEMFSRIEQVLGHKLYLYRFRKIDHTKYLLQPQWDEVRNL